MKIVSLSLLRNRYFNTNGNYQPVTCNSTKLKTSPCDTLNSELQFTKNVGEEPDCLLSAGHGQWTLDANFFA